MLVHKDHRVAHNLGAAPARGRLWGYAGESADALGEPIALGANWSYAVDGSKSTHQLFDARPADAALAGVAVRYVQLAFDANHGHPEYTCVYRVRVYGELEQ